MKPDSDLVTKCAPSTVTRPSWCPKSACVPYHAEFGPDENGNCVGIDLHHEGHPLDYVKLCNNVNNALYGVVSLNMTVDEAARTGGALACVAGLALVFCSEWRSLLNNETT